MNVAASAKGGKRKNMNFELNLVPFIDVLSVCICFLLVTAVFINLGSFHVSQAVGSEKQEQKQKTNPGSLTVSLGGDGQVRFDISEVPGRRSQNVWTIAGQRGQIDFGRTQRWIDSFASRYAGVKTVLIMPNATSRYNDLIQLMSQFRKADLDQIGIAPL